MAISKYTLYKYVKVHGTWRYCKVAYHDNGKIKPDIVFVNAREGTLEKHPEGRYYLSHNGSGSTPAPMRSKRDASASSGWRLTNTTASAEPLPSRTPVRRWSPAQVCFGHSLLRFVWSAHVCDVTLRSRQRLVPQYRRTLRRMYVSRLCIQVPKINEWNGYLRYSLTAIADLQSNVSEYRLTKRVC